MSTEMTGLEFHRQEKQVKVKKLLRIIIKVKVLFHPGTWSVNKEVSFLGFEWNKSKNYDKKNSKNRDPQKDYWHTEWHFATFSFQLSFSLFSTFPQKSTKNQGIKKHLELKSNFLVFLLCSKWHKKLFPRHPVWIRSKWIEQSVLN